MRSKRGIHAPPRRWRRGLYLDSPMPDVYGRIPFTRSTHDILRKRRRTSGFHSLFFPLCRRRCLLPKGGGARSTTHVLWVVALHRMVLHATMALPCGTPLFLYRGDTRKEHLWTTTRGTAFHRPCPQTRTRRGTRTRRRTTGIRRGRTFLGVKRE